MREGIRMSQRDLGIVLQPRDLGNIFHYSSQSRGSRPELAFGISPHIPGTFSRSEGNIQGVLFGCWECAALMEWELGLASPQNIGAWYLCVPKAGDGMGVIAFQSISMAIPEQDRAKVRIRANGQSIATPSK